MQRPRYAEDPEASIAFFSDVLGWGSDRADGDPRSRLADLCNRSERPPLRIAAVRPIRERVTSPLDG